MTTNTNIRKKLGLEMAAVVKKFAKIINPNNPVKKREDEFIALANPLVKYLYDSSSKFSEKSWAFSSKLTGAGVTYFGGYYKFNPTHDNFSPFVTFGDSNGAYGAHFLIVTGGIPAGSDTIIQVVGTSIDDEGNRVILDTAYMTVPIDTPINSYFETQKKWLGEVTIALFSGNAIDCNFGYVKYWDNNNTNFHIIGIDCVFTAGQNDANANIELLHHSASGWIYNAGAEPDTPPTEASMQNDYVTEYQLKAGQEHAWKRSNLDRAIGGAGEEGVICRVTVSTTKAIEIGTLTLRIRV